MSTQLGYSWGELGYSSFLHFHLQEWFNHVLSEILGESLVAFECQRANSVSGEWLKPEVKVRTNRMVQSRRLPLAILNLMYS